MAEDGGQAVPHHININSTSSALPDIQTIKDLSGVSSNEIELQRIDTYGVSHPNGTCPLYIDTLSECTWEHQLPKVTIGPYTI